MSKYYLLGFPRPIGIEPTIYTSKPDIKPESVEVEPGYFLTDPFSEPTIYEYNSVKEALLAIIEFNDKDYYLQDLKIHCGHDNYCKECTEELLMKAGKKRGW